MPRSEDAIQLSQLSLQPEFISIYRLESNYPVSETTSIVSQLVDTLEVLHQSTKTYIKILFQVCDLKKSEIFSEPNKFHIFLDFVIRNVRCFRYFWKNLVKDIRNGSVSSDFKIPIKIREILKSHLIADSKFSARLDSIFRSLGFHKENLKSYIDMSSRLDSGPYAKPKKQINNLSENHNLNSLENDKQNSLNQFSNYSNFMNEWSVDASKIIRFGKNYICPIPGCGMIFESNIVAFIHVKFHDNKRTLSPTDPVVDSKLRPYICYSTPWT